jgi:hypothetical protein
MADMQQMQEHLAAPDFVKSNFGRN